MHFLLVTLLCLTAVLVSESYPTGAQHTDDVLNDIEKDINSTIAEIDNELAKLALEGRASEGKLLEQYKQNGHDQIKIIEDNRPLIVPGTLQRAQQLRDNVAKEIARLERKPTGAGVDPEADINKELDAIELAIKTELAKLAAEGRAGEGAKLEQYAKNAKDVRDTVKQANPDVMPALKTWADILQGQVNDEIKRLEG